MSVRAWLAAWIAASGAALSLPAHAQRAQPVAQPEDPLVVLRQADAAYDVRDFARALQLYRRAYEQQQDPTILFNVGRMYASLEQWADAAATWTLYLERVPNAPNRAATEAMIRDAEARVQAQRASANNINNTNTTQGTVTPPPPVRMESRTRWPVGGWALTGVGGAATVTGAVLLGLYGAAVAELNSPANCTPRSNGAGFDCDPGAVAIRDRAQTFGTAGTITLSAGGAMLVGGLVWAFAGRTTERVPVVSVTQTSASIAVVGRF